MDKRIFKIVSYFTIIVSALLFLYIGNRIAMEDLPDLNNKHGSYQTVEAKVTKIHETINKNLMFEADVIKGANYKSIMAIQNIGEHYLTGTKEVEVGDKVVLSKYWDSAWEFVDYVRIDKILFLGGIFAVLLLFFGRIKGLSAILSLCLTCVAIFAVFLPSLLSGKNIYISSFIVCIYSIIVTLFIVDGINKKSIAAITGCFGGVIATGLLTFIMNKVLGITGVLNNDSMHFLYLFRGNPIDLKAVIFAGILIGAVGALMDVAMSISSALWELKCKAPVITFGTIFKSGINIGQDVMGTMTNTLVLAYIGNSLSVVLILITHIKSFTELINRELVIIELLQSIIGSLGILLTMPLTTLICAALYSKKPASSDELVETVKE